MARADEPAFPSPRERGEDHPGLTVREYYAAQFAAGFTACYVQTMDRFPTAKEIAFEAFAIADAMIAESQKK